ncbi:acid phosphatase [Sphingomonas sp. R1]|uniref:acid phosphatase n=1 Tax=Sphingomonas sp. R1 TaxID=399176 RepID=UPI002224813E|nr:phosphatase PAP2 family protein [Sphingomonas sp. R1]UYY78041.1 phosphatase PAP2 family protein [Sphingomonas sp. R1]
MIRAIAAAAAALLLAAPQAKDSGAYLAPEAYPDGLQILPPPPAAGSAAEALDLKIFRDTRGLARTSRWRIATDDVTNDPLRRSACAMGLLLDAKRAPALARLLERAGTGPMVSRVKAAYQVPRPYLRTAGGICEPKTEHLARNGDYPSGHTANGWMEALILAEVMPERATAILARGRAYGESRAICGSHSKSAVDAGYLAGAVVFAALQATHAFRDDVAAARAELAALRTTAPRPDAGQCAAEAAALAVRPW